MEKLSKKVSKRKTWPLPEKGHQQSKTDRKDSDWCQSVLR